MAVALSMHFVSHLLLAVGVKGRGTISLYHEFSETWHGVLTWGCEYGWFVGCKRAEFKRVELEWTGHNLRKAIWRFEMRSKTLQWHVHMVSFFIPLPLPYTGFDLSASNNPRYLPPVYTSSFIPLTIRIKTILGTYYLYIRPYLYLYLSPSNNPGLCARPYLLPY